MAIVGIDLGTTNSLIAAYADGKSILIPNPYNEVLTPSVVSLNEDGELSVGKAAKERLVTNPELSASLFKRDMGTDKKVTLGKKSFLPEELSSFVLRQLLSDAEKYLGEPVTEAIVSVPAYFNAHQRAATKRAGLLSGTKVERLINEPSAAALACRQDCDETFIVFDFGGGTLDVSIVESFDNIINICAISGNNLLGGADFDRMIAEAVCAENGIEISSLSKQEFQTLLRVSESAKIRVSENDSARITAILNKREISYTLNNDLLLQLSGGVLERLRRPIQLAMKDSGLSASDIDKCILVGGSCRMPIVRDYLFDLLRVPIDDGDDVNKMVALGLGMYAGIKQRDLEVKDLVLTDICPFSLNTNVHNEQNPNKHLSYTMIPRNATLPASQTQQFFTIKPGQTKIVMQISQGEQVYADDNIKLGDLSVNVPYNRKEHEKINMTFSYDINAILAAEIEVVSTGAVRSLVLTGSGLELSEKEIQRSLHNIKNLNLAHLERSGLLLERAKRIYTESDDFLRIRLMEIILVLENVSPGGSIRKINETLDAVEEYLEDIERKMGYSDIFNEPAFLTVIKGGAGESDE